MRVLLMFALAAMAAPAIAQEIEKDFDALGGNRILLERAKELQPETEAWVVQNRMVIREGRFEIAPEYSGTFGGDTYTRTQSFGLNAHYHFNHRWSVGVKYNYSTNRLTPEGESLADAASEEYANNPDKASTPFPRLDYPKSEYMALVNWYPIYGKLNLLDRGVAHFDFYLLAGYGQMELFSGSTPSMTAGGGVGLWLNPKVSTRLEMRYQNYKTQQLNTEKKMDAAIASVQVGWLL